MIRKTRKVSDLSRAIRKLESRVGEDGTGMARLRLEAYIRSCTKLGIKTALQMGAVRRVYLEALEEVARGVLDPPIDGDRIEYWERRDFSQYRTTVSLGQSYR